jgi:hypothetical protein
MIGTTAALLGSAAIGAGASILGSNKAAKASKQAAALQAKQFQETKDLLSPYTGTGQNALETYGNAIGLNGTDKQKDFYDNFQYDPGFETSLNNALSETMKRYSITGNTGGNLANALLKTGQNAIYGQYQNRLSQLGGLVDTGRSAATSLAGAGQQSAATQGNLLSQAGLYQGQGIQGAGNAISGGLGNLASVNMFDQYLNSGIAGSVVAPGANYNPFTQFAMTANKASF